MMSTLVDKLKSIFTRKDKGGAEEPIKRTQFDKGKYFLLTNSKCGDIITSVHKRIGVDVTSFTELQINMSNGLIREIGYSEGRKIVLIAPSKWYEPIPGSSKHDVVTHVLNKYKNK